MPQLDETGRPIPWTGPTWTPTGPTLGAKPGTLCDESGSHLFISGVCCDCGLEY